MAGEHTPLLKNKKGSSASISEGFPPEDILAAHRERRRRRTSSATTCCVEIEEIEFKRHITLANAIAIIVGGVAGSGIFIAPTGVTRNIGSVGGSLVMWILCGLSNIVFALCYAELGTALPLSGGDYSYIQIILGPLPAFLCLWITVLVLGPAAGAVMGRTVALYLLDMVDLSCQTDILLLIAALVTIVFAVVNVKSVLWSTRLMSVFSVAKLAALGAIIGAGVYQIATGSAEAFQDPFEGTDLRIGSMVASFLPGFIAYAGWDCVNTLVEEMVDPARNLPLSVTISMALVTFIYVLTNMAYFSVMTVTEFVASEAVAMTFATKALGSAKWVIPIVVAMSAAGSVNGLFLVYPRSAYAGAKDGEFPEVLSFVDMRRLTPSPAIYLLCACSVFFVSATFLDIQGLLAMLGVVFVLKIILTLTSLIVLKWRYPDIPRTIKIHPIIVITCLVFLLAVLGIAVVHDPLINGAGLGLFLLGIPIYFASKICSKSEGINRAMDKITIFLQQALLVIPT